MVDRLDPKETVTIDELTISNSYKIAALVAVLERKGLLTREEVLEEIMQMRKS